MRIYSLDAFRAIACFFIVFIHTPINGVVGQMFLPITRIGVPFFFMVTGFFLFKNNKEKIKKNIIKMFKLTVIANLIFFIWNVLLLLLRGKSIVEYLYNVFSIKSILQLLLLNQSPFGGHLWYLTAMLYVLIIYYFVNNTKYEKVVKYLVPLLLIIDLMLGKYSLVLFNREFPSLLVRNFLFVGLPYFYIGNIIRELFEKENIEKVNNVILLFGCCLFSITSVFEKYILVNINKNPTRDHYISTTLLVISLFILLVKNRNFLKGTKLNKIGADLSLGIYIIHPIIITIFEVGMKIMPNSFKNIYGYMSPFVIYLSSIILVSLYRIVVKQRQNNNNMQHSA